MKSTSLFIACLCSIFIFNSCKKTTDPVVDTCTKLWKVTNPGGKSIKIDKGKLIIESFDSLRTNQTITLLQDSLEGDFSLQVYLDSFKEGTSGLGAFLQVIVGNGSVLKPLTAKATIGNVSTVSSGLQIGAIVDSSGNNPGGGATNFTGVTARKKALFTIIRIGNYITSTVECDGKTESETRGFNDKNLAIALQVGTNYQSVKGHVKVQISSVVISGGGDKAKSDEFNCNSLK